MANYGPDDFLITLGGNTFEEFVDTLDGLRRLTILAHKPTARLIQIDEDRRRGKCGE